MPFAFSQPCHPVIDRPKSYPDRDPISGFPPTRANLDLAPNVQKALCPETNTQAPWLVREKDEFGRLVAPTGAGFKEAGDIVSRHSVAPRGLHPGRAKMDRMRAQHSMAGSIISGGTLHSKLQSFETLPTFKASRRLPSSSSEMLAYFQQSEAVMPGDLLMNKPRLPIRLRMAALIRQRTMDVPALMSTFLQRSAFSRMPQRGFSCIDVTTFRRAICYVFGDQWTALAMTHDELIEIYSPYILSPMAADGDGRISWRTFAEDIMRAAGLSHDNRGYLQQEETLAQRLTATDDPSGEFEVSLLRRTMEALYSHDIDTEEEKQTRVLKDVERVTGARSVAVTRYGSYESKLVGRNQLGTLKQGDFERIGGHGDYRKEQGVSADGSTVKKVNTQIGSQSHEYNADGTICVDTGGDVNQSLGYDASAAARATPYADDRRPKSAAVKRRSGSAKTTPRSTPRSTPRGSGASAVSNRSTSTPRAQRSARGPGAEKYKAVASQPGQFHGQFHAPSQRPKIVAGKVGKVVSTEGSQVKEAGDERRPTPRMAWGKIPATQ